MSQVCQSSIQVWLCSIAPAEYPDKQWVPLHSTRLHPLKKDWKNNRWTLPSHTLPWRMSCLWHHKTNTNNWKGRGLPLPQKKRKTRGKKNIYNDRYSSWSMRCVFCVVINAYLYLFFLFSIILLLVVVYPLDISKFTLYSILLPPALPIL